MLFYKFFEVHVKEYPRVSQIISPYSGYSKVPKNYLEEACTRGTAIHKACEAYLRGENHPLRVEWGHYLMSFVAQAGLIKNIHSMEVPLTDHDLKYRGTYDLVAEIDGFPGYSLVDFKTSYAEQKTWGLQLSAYENMLRKSGVEISHVFVFHLQRSGVPAKILPYDVKEYFDEFSSMCALYHKYKPACQDWGLDFYI